MQTLRILRKYLPKPFNILPALPFVYFDNLLHSVNNNLKDVAFVLYKLALRPEFSLSVIPRRAPVHLCST
jgi:hypothetical protein